MQVQRGDLSWQDAQLVDEEDPAPGDANRLVGDQVVLSVAVTGEERSWAEEELSQLRQALDLEELRPLLYHLQLASL